LACQNERVTEGIIRCFLEYIPAAARATFLRRKPLHVACRNKSTTRRIIQLLIDAAPDSVRLTDNGEMPLHLFCGNNNMKDTDAIQSLKLLIEKYPEAVRHTTNAGNLPIHMASKTKSPEFCQVLVEAYPGSERIRCLNGMLPLHYACEENNVATVEFLYKLYPDAINRRTTCGYYPIHFAIGGLSGRDNRVPAVEIVQYLLNSDPNVKLQKHRRRSLLEYACRYYCTIQTSKLKFMLSRLFTMHTQKRLKIS